MCHVHNEKWEKRNNGRNTTTKSEKNQNIRRKGKLQVLGNIKQVEMKEEIFKMSTSDEWENFSKPSSAAEILPKG